MGVYIPPCSNIESGIYIRISNIATVSATKVFAFSNANMTAIMASLRSVCWINGNKLNTVNLTLIFKERAELRETPRVNSSTECLIAFLRVYTQSDILQILNSYAFLLFLCFRYDLLAYAVIDNSGKSSFTPFQPFQQPMTVACAFGLNRSPHFVVSNSYVFDFFGGNVCSVRQGNNISNSHIDTNEILCKFFFLIGYIYSLVEIKLAVDKNKVGLTFRILHKLWAIANVCYFLTTTNKRNRTNRLGNIVGKHTAIISDCSKLPKMPLLLPIEFICIGNLANCSHDKLRRKVVCFFNGIINLLMQTELFEHTAFPRYLGDSVTSLIENTKSIFQYYGLLIRWKQFYL